MSEPGVYTLAVTRFLRYGSACCAFAFVLLFGAAAWSQEEAPEGEAYYYTEYEQSWYGWQTLAVDVPTLSVFFFTLREDKPVPAYTSLTLFTLGGPAVHGAHRRWKVAALSGLSRVTFSLVGAVGVQKIAEGIDGDASENAQRAAAVVATDLLAVSLDAFVLSYEEKASRVELSDRGRAWWTPQVAWTGRGGWLGVGGGF